MVKRKMIPGYVDTLPESITVRGNRFDYVGGGIRLGWDNRETADYMVKDFIDGLTDTYKIWNDIPEREIVIVPFMSSYGTKKYGIYQRVFRDKLTGISHIVRGW
jgi:hypothetical protein